MARPFRKAERARLARVCVRCGRATWQGRCENAACPRYRIGDRLRFKAGAVVVVRDYPTAGSRVVERVYTDIDGGRQLDEPVDGFVSWNVEALRSATKTEVRWLRRRRARTATTRCRAGSRTTSRR